MKIRIGNGYDIHRLKQGNYLVLGGVKIPFNKSFIAHSDGDVLIHSLIDAILGALALGDIGTFFPDTNNKYKDISSVTLLNEIYKIIKSKGYNIINIDSNIIAQEPKLNPFILKIRENIQNILNIPINNISIKAKTMEKLGPIGNLEAIEANCVVLLQKTNI